MDHTLVLILAFDTSTMIASVAIAEGERGQTPRIVVARDVQVTRHSDNLLPLLDDILAEASIRPRDLDAVAIGAGPGSFTGLRIGMSTAKGLAFAAGIPLWAVSSLAALAASTKLQLEGNQMLVPVMDARRREIFTGFYRPDAAGLASLAPERVLPPAELAALFAELHLNPDHAFLLGDGAELYADELHGLGTTVEGARATPSGTAVAELALLRDLPDVLTTGSPAYIRPSEAEIKFPDGNPGGPFTHRK